MEKKIEVQQLADVEEESTLGRESPRQIQRRHPPNKMIGNLHECFTRRLGKRVRHHISHILFLLPPLSLKILDMLYLIQTGSIVLSTIIKKNII
jgi:hypothetical protein